MIKLDYPATRRNREPIAEVLKPILSPGATVLEVASGSGQHVHYFGEMFPDVEWQPSDIHDEALASIDAWSEPLKNVRPAILLDVGNENWPEGSFDVVMNINMIHISPWQATWDLFRGVGQVLKPDGSFFQYGPFFVAGEDPAPSNVAFDRSLRERNPDWGIRQLEEVANIASGVGLRKERVMAMPANNLSVIWTKGL